MHMHRRNGADQRLSIEIFISMQVSMPWNARSAQGGWAQPFDFAKIIIRLSTARNVTCHGMDGLNHMNSFIIFEFLYV